MNTLDTFVRETQRMTAEHPQNIPPINEALNNWFRQVEAHHDRDKLSMTAGFARQHAEDGTRMAMAIAIREDRSQVVGLLSILFTGATVTIHAFAWEAEALVDPDTIPAEARYILEGVMRATRLKLNVAAA